MMLSLLLSFIMYAQSTHITLQQGIDAYKNKNDHQALHYLNQVLEQDPNNLNALLFKANVLHLQLKTDQALPYIDKALQLSPRSHQLIASKAMMCNTIGLFEDALACYEKIYDTSLNDEQAQTKLPPLYMRRMDWNYALKFIKVDNLWWYDEDITNKHVLLDLTSQWNGLGDVMQIIRYAVHLKKAGAYIIVKVRDELIPLLKLCPYIDRLIGKKEPNPEHDHRYYLLADNCTVAMRSTLYDKAKTEVPYLFADQKLVDHFKERLKNNHTFKVGLCWQATPMMMYFTRQRIPGARSLFLHELESLFQTPNTTFYNLQKGEDTAIRSFNAQSDAQLVTFEQFDTSGAFMQTAALIKNLDLVITVDTSVAHLAGALGVPVWLMLAHAADFRWFSDRSDCPWYPTMRLFRQKKQYEWEPVIKTIKDELLALTQPVKRLY